MFAATKATAVGAFANRALFGPIRSRLYGSEAAFWKSCWNWSTGKSTMDYPPRMFSVSPTAFRNRLLLLEKETYHRALRIFSTYPANGNVPSRASSSELQTHRQQGTGTKKTTTIIEPPIRTRPFRHFRGSTTTTLRRPVPTTKRVILNNPQHHIKTPHVSWNENELNQPQSGSLPVHAFHVAQSIALPKVISNVFSTRSVRKMLERSSVVVQLQPHPEDTSPRFVAVFRFGSVVFFNVTPRDQADILWEIKQCSVGPVLSGSEIKEKFCVHIQPPGSQHYFSTTTTTRNHHHNNYDGTNTTASSDSENTSASEDGCEEPEIEDVVTGDYCVVPELNMKAVDVISNIMAQSVALDSYQDTVDELLADFERINKAVVVNGNLAALHRDQMFRVVALNNAIFIDMVSKVGIKDRIDTAWNLSQYEDISQGLIDEFDIEQRFEHIEFKLNLIQQNAKFFLEVLAHQKSNSLEWIIIVLIMFECVLMCMEMSGVGGPFFQYLASLNPSMLDNDSSSMVATTTPQESQITPVVNQPV